MIWMICSIKLNKVLDILFVAGKFGNWNADFYSLNPIVAEILFVARGNLIGF